MADLANVQQRVQTFITKHFSQVGLTDGNRITVDYKDNQIFIWVVQLKNEEASTIVKFLVPILLQAPRSPELFEYVALHADDYFFGHLSVTMGDDGTCLILLDHNLLGDYVDEAEVDWVVGAMLGASDELSKQLKEKFGGRTFAEPVLPEATPPDDQPTEG